MPDLGAADLILGFLLLITPVVFFHELGHYWVARKAGVIVDVFSVGFGPEIYGWTAKTGTRILPKKSICYGKFKRFFV